MWQHRIALTYSSTRLIYCPICDTHTHTHDVDERTTYRLELTTILPSTRSRINRTRRQPMKHTTAHALDLVMTHIFLVKPTRHQLSNITLATHLILYVPIITPKQSRNTVQQVRSYQYTLQLILATITLKRYHKVWFTILDVRSHTATLTSPKCPLGIPPS